MIPISFLLLAVKQAGEPASSSNGVGMPSDLYTEASGYLIDPEPSEMSQQQWGVQQQISSPVWHAPSVFPPIPQHQMPGEMEVPVGLGSSSGGLDANASSDGGSTVSARCEVAFASVITDVCQTAVTVH